MSKAIIIFGAGGQAKVVAAIAKACGYDVAGFISPDGGAGVIAKSEDDPAIAAYTHGVIGVGDNGLRRKIAARVRKGFHFVTLVHPSAVVEPTAKIGAGSVIHAKAYVGVDTIVGDHVIINTGAQIDHDGRVGDYASLAPGVIAGGTVLIGTGAFVGLGASIINDITIGADAVVGAGTTVVRDVEDNIKIFRKSPLIKGSA